AHCIIRRPNSPSVALRPSRLLLLGLALLAAALPCARQARAQREVEWSLLDGLPTTVITAVLQDGEGFVWIGTHVGLARSDGHTVEVFRPDARDRKSTRLNSS